MEHKNSHTIVGELVNHYGIKKTGTGKSVCSMLVATTIDGRTRKLKCTAWEGAADKTEGWKPGDLVGIVGEVVTSSYDKDGVKQFKTETVINDPKKLELLEAGEADNDGW